MLRLLCPQILSKVINQFQYLLWKLSLSRILATHLYSRTTTWCKIALVKPLKVNHNQVNFSLNHTLRTLHKTNPTLKILKPVRLLIWHLKLWYLKVIKPNSYPQIRYIINRHRDSSISNPSTRLRRLCLSNLSSQSSSKYLSIKCRTLNSRNNRCLNKLYPSQPIPRWLLLRWRSTLTHKK